jgi:hypothetical protein
MERLFSPCTRLHDIIESELILVPPEELQELNLDVPTDEFLSAERAFTYADLFALLANENAVLWLTPHAGVVPAGGKQGLKYCGQLHHFSFYVDGKVIRAYARFEHLSEICDVVLRLLVASVVHSGILRNWNWNRREIELISAPTLAYLM